MRFLPDVPPAKTFAGTGQRYDLAIELANKGTFPLRGRLFLSGFDPNIVNFPPFVDIPTQQCGFAEIFPKSRSTPDGGICVEEFQAQLDMRSVADIYDAPLLATLIYPYVTDANIVLCVDPDIYRARVTKKACTMTPVSASGGQGAPVAVTRVEPTSVGDGKVMFRITVANVGSGEIVDYNKRPSELRPTDFNNVYYKVGTPAGRGRISRIRIGGGGMGINIPLGRAFDVYYSGGSFGFNFNPTGNYQYDEGTVKLYNGKATITTIIDYSDVESAFNTPLQISLAYGYMEQMQRSLRIVNIENFGGFEQRGGFNIIYDRSGQRIELDSNGRIRYRDPNFDIQLGNIIRNI
ncbi:hypothetical protein HY639_05425 [Candidatus Woesearchaeota archaeon]|nr:hypothetical protein [Candidatus Woesearchaeota archaeon]